MAMFIEIEEMGTVVAGYKLEEITDCDDSLVQSCIVAAVKRVRRLLSGRYDVERVFTATGDERDPELVEIVKDVALWFIVRRCNVDLIYAKVREVYDRDMDYLKELRNGGIPSELPLREDGEGGASAFRSGSNPKFTHSW
ncbi:MAG: hypothetical protein ACI305_08475 [Lepagella sp.]